MTSVLAPFCAFCRKGLDYAEFLVGCDPLKAELENIKLYKDVLGNHWCEEHKYRGKVIDWGAMHGWPLLNLYDGTVEKDRSGEIMVIPDGAFYWQSCLAVSKNEEVGYLAEAIIDLLESEAQAS